MPQIDLVDLSEEVWFEHILPFLPSSALLSTRLINHDFYTLILSYMIKFKSEFKIKVGYPDVLLEKIVQPFLSKLENLKTISYEDYNLMEDYCLTDKGLSELHVLQHVENVDLKKLSSDACDGSFIVEWIEKKSPIIQTLKTLSLNYVKSDVCKLFDKFENLKILFIGGETSLETLKLPTQLEDLEIVYFIQQDLFHQIIQQCPNLKRLSVYSNSVKEIREDFKHLKNLNSLNLQCFDYTSGYEAAFYESLQSLENLTELHIPWPLVEPNSTAWDNLKYLGQLDGLKTLTFRIVNGETVVQNTKPIERVLETICNLHSLTNLNLDFSCIDNDLEVTFDTDFLNNIPSLNLDRFSYTDTKSTKGGTSFLHPFFAPKLKSLYYNSSYDLEIGRDQYFSNLEHIQIVNSPEKTSFNLMQQICISNVKSLRIDFGNLETLEIISNMSILEELVIGFEFISSFKTVKLPKILKKLWLKSCRFLTGNEENFFESFIQACPLLEQVDFTDIPCLQDPFVRKVCNWVENGADYKNILFLQCSQLTNDSVYYFKEAAKVKFVIFQDCREIHHTREISEILTRHDFIQIFGGIDTFSNNVTEDSHLINSLEELKSTIINSIDLKKHKKAFLQIHNNLFNKERTEVDENPLLKELIPSDEETRWFFYFSMVKCASTALNILSTESYYSVIDHCFMKCLEMVFTNSKNESNLNNTEEKKNSLIELLDTEMYPLFSDDSFQLIIEKLLENRNFDKLSSMYVDGNWHEKMVDSMTEEEIFQLPYLHNLLTLNFNLLPVIVNKSRLFKNSPSFMDELKNDLNIEIESNDPESLDVKDRVPNRFKNSFLTEIIVPVNESTKSGESSFFEAFGYYWSLKLSEECGWTEIYFKLVSAIPISTVSNSCEYENLSGANGSSIDVSFMLLNFDNNPHNYFSGRKTLNQSEMECYLSIRSDLVKRYSENSYKFLVGLDVLGIKEKIPCPFLSSNCSIHNISFNIPLELKEYYFNEIRVYSDPIVVFGVKWTVKLEKELDSGIIGLYLMLASFDLLDGTALSACRVFFHFANKNLHPDSTHSCRKTFQDMSSCIGTTINNHPELFKPDEIVINGERFEKYDITLIMDVKTIS